MTYAIDYTIQQYQFYAHIDNQFAWKNVEIKTIQWLQKK